MPRSPESFSVATISSGRRSPASARRKTPVALVAAAVRVVRAALVVATQRLGLAALARAGGRDRRVGLVERAAGRSSTAAAGAMSQRPRQETSTISISTSSPYRAFASRIRSSEPCSQHVRSWQTASCTAFGGDVRKCG